ncbi:MAG: carboxy terminal-processing peptidase, partial [Gammaproteobacteria bacterium]
EPTFGKGTVQNLVDLNRFDQSMKGKLGQLKATIAQFFRVNGGSTQHRGVLPDIVLPTVISMDEHGERSLENALPWAAIQPARYTPVSFAADALPPVRRRHEERILGDAAFQAVLDTEKAIKEARAKTSVSLVESTRRAEHEQAKRDQRRRENAIRVARGLEPLPDEVADDDDALDDLLADGDSDDGLSDDDDDDSFDVVLDEAGRILRDWIGAGAGDGDPRLVDADHDAVAPPLNGPAPAKRDAARVH